MTTFNYEALNTKGEQIDGTIDAETEASAIVRLRSQGFYPTKLYIKVSEEYNTLSHHKFDHTVAISILFTLFKYAVAFSAGYLTACFL